MTIREKLFAALQNAGHGPLLEKSERRWVLGDRRRGLQNGKPISKFFLGSNGALRVGTSWTNSVSLTDSKPYKDLLAKGEALLGAPAPVSTASLSAIVLPPLPKIG